MALPTDPKINDPAPRTPKPDEGESTYMSTGLCIGLALGSVFGQLNGNLATGMCIGMCLGLTVGSCIKQKKHSDQKDENKR